MVNMFGWMTMTSCRDTSYAQFYGIVNGLQWYLCGHQPSPPEKMEEFEESSHCEPGIPNKASVGEVVYCWVTTSIWTKKKSRPITPGIMVKRIHPKIALSYTWVNPLINHQSGNLASEFLYNLPRLIGFGEYSIPGRIWSWPHRGLSQWWGV